MKKTLAASMLAMCCATSAFAMDSMNSMDMSKMMTEKCMEMADANGDGMISKEENMAMAEKMMKDADTNNDGLLKSISKVNRMPILYG
jgi:hypothetical protein